MEEHKIIKKGEVTVRQLSQMGKGGRRGRKRERVKVKK